MLRFIGRSARFIVPLPFAILAAMTFLNGLETGRLIIYLASLVNVLLAGWLYVVQLKAQRKRDMRELPKSRVF